MSYKWFEIQDHTAYHEKFRENKIIWIELSNTNRFYLSKDEIYLLAGSFMILGEDLEFLNAYLNSKVALYLFNIICNSSGMSTKQWKKFAINKLIVPQNIKSEIKEKIINLVKSIYLKKINYEKAIIDIDNLFFEIFGLSEEEIALMNNID